MRPQIVHLELHTPDLVGAGAFYRQLLGWAPETVVTMRYALGDRQPARAV